MSKATTSCSECLNKNTIRPGFEIHDCPNMKPDPTDRDMDCERYVCFVCGKRASLDYEEMK